MKLEVSRSEEGKATFKIITENGSDELALRILEDSFEKKHGLVCFDWDSDLKAFVCFVMEK